VIRERWPAARAMTAMQAEIGAEAIR